MAKFNIGDVITPGKFNQGFENAEVLEIITKKAKEYYVLKIQNGLATIPVTAECNYELVSSKETTNKSDKKRKKSLLSLFK